MALKVLIYVCVCLFVPAYANDPSASFLYCHSNAIRNYSLATRTETVVLYGLGNDAQAIDFHFEKRIIFWSDYTDEKIYRTSMSQSGINKAAILESAQSMGIAVDWFHDLLYWTNNKKRTVEVAKLDGSERRTLIEREEGSTPMAIVLNPVEGFIFWTDIGENKKIERCKVDGTNRTAIVSESLDFPFALAIDLDGRWIFWSDYNKRTLNTVTFDGTQRRIIYTHTPIYLTPHFLDVDHEYLYWSVANSIHRAKKENGGDYRSFFGNVGSIRGVKIFSPLKQPKKGAPESLVANVTAEKRQCVNFFLETRSNSSVNKWGQELPRTAVALYLTDQDFFAPENKTGQEIRYELAIHLLYTLNRHDILRTERLTMYVHALLVSCLNPRNFFRHDLVSELRKRVDTSKYVNPFAILALCNAGAAMTDQDVQRLNETYISEHVNYWTEVQVICTMALSCISSKTNVSVDQELLRQWVKSAKDYPLADEAAVNPRTVALIVQLMLSTNYSRDFNWTAAVQAITNPTFVNSSNFLDKYYLTPVLSNKGLNAIDNKHCFPYSENDLLYSSNPDLITVRYTVRAEKDVSFGKSWSIKMSPSSTLYDVIMTVQTMDTDHTVKFNMVNGKPYVGTVSGLAEDPEYDNYWYTYVCTQEAAPDLRLLEESPKDVSVTEEDEFIIWYRNAIWKTNSYVSGEHH